MCVLLQHLTALFGFLEKLSVPTHPYQIREAIASSLLKLWPLVLLSGHDDIAKCCRLVLGLLQDSDGDVRREMAAAVSELLAGTYASIISMVDPKFNVQLHPL